VDRVERIARRLQFLNQLHVCRRALLERPA
jgi:hypothetical protein